MRNGTKNGRAAAMKRRSGSWRSGSLQKHGQDFFPLSFNAEQFIVICRHKLSLLTQKKG